MGASSQTKLLLAFRSGDRCALPDCKRELSPDSKTGNPTNRGKAAHIAGEKPKSARHDPNMTDEQRNHYNNLIYLCPDCHDKIDIIPHGETDYPVELLLQVKREHEREVQEAVNEKFADVGFSELEEATQWISHVPQQPLDVNFSVIPPDAKLKKNDLGEVSRRVITMGLSVVREVQSFVESKAQADLDFPKRLQSGFMQEYLRLRKQGYKGDVLFDLMCRFAQQGFRDEPKRAAGRAVLVYLFEACEVFEK